MVIGFLAPAPTMLVFFSSPCGKPLIPSNAIAIINSIRRLCPQIFPGRAAGLKGAM